MATVSRFPKAALAIVSLPGVESLEKEGDLWCCHLLWGWTTEALGGGGTVIDSNLATIRAHVKGAYQLPPVPAPTASGPLLPGEAAAPAAPAAPAPLAPAPALPVWQSQHQQQPQQGPALQIGPSARIAAPSHLPADARRLLQRFELDLDAILTMGASNAKIAKGLGEAFGVIHHTLPGRSLGAAVHGPIAGPTAPRSRLEEVRRLALANELGALVEAFLACPWASEGCLEGCLAWAGHGGISTNVASCRGRRGLARLWEPKIYSIVLLWAIAKAYAKAKKLGLPLAVRLKGTDDIGYHLQRFNLSASEAAILARRYGLPAIPGNGTTLPEVLQIVLGDGSLQWYEYSKAPVHGHQGLKQMRDCGIDVTASLAADRKGGLADAMAAVGAGFRLAVPIAFPKGATLPEALLLRNGDTIQRLKCIDGDQSDNRWLDRQGPQEGGWDGVAVILRTKRSNGRGPEAAAFSLAPVVGQWQTLKGGGQAALSATA
ncbi:hypothetical protein UFOVP383_79 [uncultured Caudovirales phage]|uniref:Uncharacterized protein n=1 Tax=uncultured Caudovirales phage TaxID=2100421 RepID=A0A6J7WZN8_9CAUD|nr:hypothetical protein UFOVP383_79 [uncultured Caudovirales phage]